MWGRAASSYLQKLQSLQNRSLKIIFDKPLLFSTLSLFSDTSHNILPLAFLCNTQTLLFVHDILHNNKTHHNIQLTTSNLSHRTRQHNNLQRIRANTTFGQKRFQVIGPKIFNQLPSTLQTIDCRTVFNVRIKQYYKQKLNELFH